MRPTIDCLSVAYGADNLIEEITHLSGDKITVANCQKSPQLWGVGRPPATCGGTTYIAATVPDQPVTPIYTLDASGTATQVASVDIKSDDYVFGTLACAP